MVCIIKEAYSIRLIRFHNIIRLVYCITRVFNTASVTFMGPPELQQGLTTDDSGETRLKDMTQETACDSKKYRP